MGNMSSKKKKKQPRSDLLNLTKTIDIGFELTETMLIDDYQFLKCVGKGCAKIMKVRKNSDGNVYAMKVWKKKTLPTAGDLTQLRSILANIDHPFIISLNYAFQTASKLYLVLDFFNAQELLINFKGGCHFSLEKSIFYSAEISIALGHIHSLNIIYGALTPKNVLLNNDGHILITDYNLTTKSLQNDKLVGTFTSDFMYAAPEIIQNKQILSKAVDWWSFGILLHEMMTGLPPFTSTEQILNNSIKFASNFNQNAKHLLLGLLESDPSNRIGSMQVFNIDLIKKTLLSALKYFKADHMFIVNTVMQYIPQYVDAEDIQAQPLYNDIDFDKLSKKQITPPFDPKIVPIDISGVDDDFTMEQLHYNQDINLNVDMFRDFTYNPQP